MNFVNAFHFITLTKVDQSLKSGPLIFINANVFFIELPMFAKVPWCSPEHVDCMNKIRTIIASIQPPKHSHIMPDPGNNPIGLNCSCMPGCREVVNFSITTIRKPRFLLRFSSNLHFCSRDMKHALVQ